MRHLVIDYAAQHHLAEAGTWPVDIGGLVSPARGKS
jgi:hypothetical protein